MSSPKFDQRVHAFGRYCVRTLLWKLAFLPLQSQFVAQVKKQSSQNERLRLRVREFFYLFLRQPIQPPQQIFHLGRLLIVENPARRLRTSTSFVKGIM